MKPPNFSWKLRWALRLMPWLIRLRLMPSHESVARWPQARRKALKPPAWMTFPPPASVHTQIERIAGADGDIALKWFRTQPTQRPSILFIHGGGWVVGGPDSLDYLCANLCDRLGVAVVAVDYRLAPDHRFPAALHDCYSALQWVAARAAAPVVVIGDSAGGNLSAALCLLARERGGPAIAQQTLIYPALDLALESPSMRMAMPGARIDDMAAAVQHYLGNHDRRDPLVSPIHAPDLRGLPPAFIVTADYDLLRDDGPRYAQGLRDAGVPVRYVNYPDMPHGFLSQPKLCPGAPGALADIVEELRRFVTPA
ncbi:alpha/beta hydrolase [Hydrocarboniphaga sp.]|uniref:alpha/beta hydrolase n=1 Tax=Hydrocarboniphaga sp. TaxID=2033016 RepID=UPI003D0A759D